MSCRIEYADAMAVYIKYVFLTKRVVSLYNAWEDRFRKFVSVGVHSNKIPRLLFLAHLSTKSQDSPLSFVRQFVSACVNVFIQTTSSLKPLNGF